MLIFLCRVDLYISFLLRGIRSRHLNASSSKSARHKSHTLSFKEPANSSAKSTLAGAVKNMLKPVNKFENKVIITATLST